MFSVTGIPGSWCGGFEVAIYWVAVALGNFKSETTPDPFKLPVRL
jgi:hypothetical protein